MRRFFLHLALVKPTNIFVNANDIFFGVGTFTCWWVIVLLLGTLRYFHIFCVVPGYYCLRCIFVQNGTYGLWRSGFDYQLLKVGFGAGYNFWD